MVYISSDACNFGLVGSKKKKEFSQFVQDLVGLSR